LWCALAGVALLLARASLTTSALVLAGVALAVATLVRPGIGLAALALAVPFGSVREITLGPASVGAAELWAVFVVAAWLAQMLAHGQVRAAGSRLWLAFGLLLAAMLLSVTQALSLGHSVKELSKWLELGAVALCAASLRREGERRLIVGAALLAGIGAGLLGWYQFLFRVGPEGFVLFGRFMRAYGTFRQPNPYAGYLGILLPVAVSVLIAYWPWRRRQGWSERALWLLAATSAAVVGPAIVMSWSRGAWLGVAAGLAVVLLGRSRRFAALFVVLAVALAGIFVVAALDRYVPASLTTRLTDFADYFSWGDVSGVKPNSTNWAVIERMAHWQAAARMFAAHPWLGVGIGNYEAVYPVYRLERWSDPLGHAHNYYLNIAAESGVVGLAAYLVFWLAAGWLALRATRRQSGLWRGMALGIVGALVHLSVHNLFDNLYVQGIYLQVGLWVGLLIPLARTEQREHSVDV